MSSVLSSLPILTYSVFVINYNDAITPQNYEYCMSYILITILYNSTTFYSNE